MTDDTVSHCCQLQVNIWHVISQTCSGNPYQVYILDGMFPGSRLPWGYPALNQEFSLHMPLPACREEKPSINRLQRKVFHDANRGLTCVVCLCFPGKELHLVLPGFPRNLTDAVFLHLFVTCQSCPCAHLPN